MRKISFILFSFAAMGLAGCSTTHIDPSDAKEVQPLNFATSQNIDASNVTFVRDVGAYSCGLTVGCLVDGILALKLESGEKASIKLDPGMHSFVCQGQDIFGAHNAASINHTLTLNAKDELVFRVGFSHTSTVLILQEKNGQKFQTALE